MAQQHVITTYLFGELSEDAQQRAVDNLRSINVEDEFWHESALEDAREICKLLGVDVDNIYFSGFYSQGDGACIVGSYRYMKGAANALRAWAPVDSALHSIAAGLQDVQRRNFYQLAASVTHTGRYYHEYSVGIDVDRLDGARASDDDKETVAEALRDLMRWVYRSLEREHEYLTSDEAVTETIEANEYQFEPTGSLY